MNANALTMGDNKHIPFANGPYEIKEVTNKDYKPQTVEQADKRYLVFAFSDYYPGGGLGDVRDSFNELDKGIEFATGDDVSSDYRYIYDRIDGVVVWDWDEHCKRLDTLNNG